MLCGTLLVSADLSGLRFLFTFLNSRRSGFAGASGGSFGGTLGRDALEVIGGLLHNRVSFSLCCLCVWAPNTEQLARVCNYHENSVMSILY